MVEDRKILVAVLQASFKDTIERGFSCPSEATPARRREYVAELGVGGKRAQRGTVTRQRIARADEDGGSRKDPAKRVEVILCRCAGQRLNQHDRPIGCERFASAPGSANRIVHVVQAVEESNQIVSSDRGWVRAGASDLEAYPVGQTRRARRLTGALNRGWVIVVPNDLRARIRLGQDERGGPVAAPNIGDARACLKLCHDPRQGRQPRLHNVLLVARTKETLGALEQIRIVLAPVQPATSSEVVRDAFLGPNRPQKQLVAAHQVGERLRVVSGGDSGRETHRGPLPNWWRAALGRARS